MRFVEALPPFGTKQWRMLVILLLDALSIHRLPRLGVHFSNNRTMLRQVLFDHFFFATPQKSVEIAGLKTSRMPAAVEGFLFRCLNVTHHFSVQVLETTGTSEAEYDVFRDVVLPLGRSPTFASRSGG